MAIGIDELDDDDILEVLEPNEPAPSQPIQEPSSEEDDFMSDFLRSKGIDDPSKIKFEDENGRIEERDWNSLTREEQINILNTPVTQPSTDNNDLYDEEIELLNSIRQSGLTPQLYILQLQLNTQPAEPVYKIDDLSDDELYLLDLESRVGELSDDEAALALNVAKLNESFYKKQVEGIRKEYKEREDYLTQQELALLEQQQIEAFNKYLEQVIGAIDGFTSVGNLDLNFEDKDKEELAEFMLSQDETGSNFLYKALQDPETLVRAAWFILNGEEAFNNVADYFTNQIKLVSENQYKKGLEDARNGVSRKPLVVILKNNNQHRVYKSIEDLDDED